MLYLGGDGWSGLFWFGRVGVMEGSWCIYSELTTSFFDEHNLDVQNILLNGLMEQLLFLQASK